MSMRRSGHSRRQASVDYPRYPPINSTTQQPPVQVEMLSQTILASDYESDNQGYTSDFPGVAPPTSRTREELNLAVVQKWNSDVSAILSVVPYATIYYFASAASEWQKSGLVGTLFICQLTPGEFGEDRYQAIVLNRSGLENFEAELRQSERGGVSMQGDFVEITRQDPETGETKINAIYIYSENGTSTAGSRTINGELMVSLAQAAQKSYDAAWAHANNLHLREPTPQFQPEPEPEPQRMYMPTQSSPAPQIAPVPNRQLDLLALLRGHQSDTESVNSRPPENHTNVYDLFRNSGAL